VELLRLNRLLKESVIKISDLSFACFVNRNSDVSVEKILDASLANDWRKIAPHYRAAEKRLEHLWFVDGREGKTWDCVACASTSDQACISNLRLQMDACKSFTRFDSKAISRRDVQTLQFIIIETLITHST
jgi:hypothetical protein